MNIEGKQQSLLTFRVGPVLCCAPSLPVRSIITPPKLTHPPGSDTSQPGIFKHGSHIVKVLDLRQKFGVDPTEQTQPGNLIITIFEKESFAFWVDQILDVFDFPSTGWGNLPAAIPRGVFSRTLLLNKKIHLYSEFEKLATINDLGYLKHYIQQLQQQVSEKTIDDNTVALTSPQATRQDKENIINETNVANKSFKPDAEIKFNNIKEEKPVAATQLSSSSNTKPDTTTTKVSPKTFASKTSETDSNFTAKKNIIKKPLSNKVLNTTPVTAISRPEEKQPITTKKELKSLTHIESKTEDKPVISQTTSSIESTEEDENGSYFGIVFFFLFLLAGLGVALYYLLYEDDMNKNYKYKKEQAVNTVEYNYATNETYESETFSSPEQTTLRPDKSDVVSNNSTNNDIIENIQNKESESVINNDYQAKITQRNDEITITIHEPVSNNQSLQAEELISPEPVIKDEIKEDEIKHEKIIETSPVNLLKEKELAKTIKPEKVINEVVHVVVKGDTLWAIAKKYVHNPFLYPELARLSKIKNPHRIYPGNRVRIRFIKN